MTNFQSFQSRAQICFCSAGFQTCCAADFQIGASRKVIAEAGLEK
jgi:hypothetical protein